jgi:uncharacterized membrane-anchored protein YitT (DUF2179 family)
MKRLARPLTSVPWVSRLSRILWNLLLLAGGSCVCAVAVNAILVPKGLLAAGFTGLAIIIHYFASPLSVSSLYFFLNVPLFALGWKYVGRRFFLYSIVGMIIFSAAVRFVHVTIPLEEKGLAVLLAGILMGIGSGIILRSLGSAGGVDILSVMLLKKFSIRAGSTSLAFNAILLGVCAFLVSLDMVLYTLVYIYVTSSVLNVVVTGLSQRKAVFIISSRWHEISHGIIEEIQQGVTILQGEGGFTRKAQRVLYTVVTFRELARLKQMIRKTDPGAFVVVTETLEVMGQRIGNQPHW